ncbi:unnamed protein product [Calypogeia fissa]
MAMAALSGFHVVISKKQQLVAGWKNCSDFQETVVGLGRGSDASGGHYGRQILCRAPATPAAAVISSGKKEGARNSSGKKKAGLPKEGASKGGSSRGEPVMAFRDQVAVCALASAMLERFSSTTSGVVLDDAVTFTSLGRELSPAGDSASSSVRSRLESQWTKFLLDRTEVDPESRLLSSLREGKEEDISVEDENAALASSSSSQQQLGDKKVVSSGRPKARLRRLDARRKRMSSAAERPPADAFTIFPRKRADGKSDHKKVEMVQGYVSTYMREITKIDRLTADEEVMLSKIIRVGYLMKEERKKLEKQVGHELSKQQWAEHLHMTVAELDAKLHEAELARDRMVMANLRLVVSVVKQYSCEGLEVADLIQEGSIGLLKGVEKFDHTRGYKLSTYVHWWIRQGVTRAIADHSRTVRLPVHVHDALGRIRRAKARMLVDGESVTVESLSELLNLTSSQIMTALKVPKKPKSLDMQVGLQRNFLKGDSETFHSLVADQHTENQPWIMVERAQLKGDVERILNTHLGSREREIIKMHFGVDTPDGYPMSLENISHRYGISRERVRQLERAAKQKLQTTQNGLEKYCCMFI